MVIYLYRLKSLFLSYPSQTLPTPQKPALMQHLCTGNMHLHVFKLVIIYPYKDDVDLRLKSTVLFIVSQVLLNQTN